MPIQHYLGNQLLMQRLGFYDFDLSAITFTAGMAKRAGNGPFAAAPICQGHWDGTGTPDVTTFVRGDQLGNPTGSLYANLDINQGSIVFWITPEWAGNDGLSHHILSGGASSRMSVYKTAGNVLRFSDGAPTSVSVDVSAWTAGTTYFVVVRWDSKRTLDGTNYACVSVNDVHTFGITSISVVSRVTYHIGTHDNETSSSDSIIEGLTIYRRPLWDGAYGTCVNGPDYDEINLIYAAGAGADPTVITGGSWDIPFCLPTDSAVGALVTGTGEAWSHPLESGSIETHPLADDGFYGGYAWALTYDGDNDYVDCGSPAGLDDLPNGATMTVDVWYRYDATAGAPRMLVGKGTAISSNGWYMQAASGDILECRALLATTTPIVSGGNIRRDGKWHLATFYYDDATKTARAAVDGVWGSASVGVGAYQSDAAGNLRFGIMPYATTRDWIGALGWGEISNNDRHGGAAGTDFIPPRVPYDDGNTTESWHVDDGSGGTVAATVASPGNDGTITGATWEAQWDQDTSPVIPVSLEFYGENDGIDYGSGANIDDLPSGDCTIEFWARLNEDTATLTYLLTKTNAAASIGWWFRTAGATAEVRFVHATPASVSFGNVLDGRWHHLAADWDQGTLTLRGFVDGVFVGTATGVGAYSADAAEDCLVNARNAIGAGDGSFAIGPIRLSNNRRYTGTYFVVAPRTNWHANDANAHLLCTMHDGAGATVADTSGNGYNGTVTFGATTQWHNTPDMEVDAPGARGGPWGYSIGADAANDGFTQIITGLTAGDDYVVRAPISWDPDVVAQPAIRIYDEIGAAQIVQFAAPLLTGLHTGANNSATLIVAGARFTQSLIGQTLDNVTDGSTTTITAVSGDGTTITGVLGGGTDNDWDTNDVFRIRTATNWVWAETFCFTLPALCTSISVQARNLTTTGLFYLHQVEVIENLLQNGDHESLTGGNPDLITGWGNTGLDVGDTQASSGGGAVIHSGAEALQWNVGAVAAESMTDTPGYTVGRFCMMGAWLYGDGTTGVRLRSRGTAYTVLHSDPTVIDVGYQPTAVWQENAAVFRTALASFLALNAGNGGVGNRYSDDAYTFELDAVSLTVTPASQANSLESSGIRVDGRDSCTQPIPVGRIGPTSGRIRWRMRPRHADANFRNFEEAATPFVAHFAAPGGNYISLDMSAANTLQLEVNDGVATNGTVVGPGLVADTEYLFEIRYTGVNAQLYIDSILQITVTPGGGINFGADIPTTAYWGLLDTGANQADAVFLNPI